MHPRVLKRYKNREMRQMWKQRWWITFYWNIHIFHRFIKNYTLNIETMHNRKGKKNKNISRVIFLAWQKVVLFVSIWISTTWWVSLLVDQWVPEGTCSQVLRSTSVDSWRLRASKYTVFKIDWNCNFVGLLHHPFWLQLVLALFGYYFSTFYTTCLAKDHWRGFSTRNAHMIHIVNLFRLKWCIHLSRSLYLNSFKALNIC